MQNSTKIKTQYDIIIEYCTAQYRAQRTADGKGHVQNPPAIKIYPVRFENRLLIKG